MSVEILGTTGISSVQDGIITEGKIANLAITNGKIADSAINSSKIADGGIGYNDLPSGTILQIVQGVLADPVTATTASAWTTIGLSAVIIPKFINSKILVTVHIGVGSNGTSSYDACFGLFRNGSQIALPNNYGLNSPSFMPFGDRNQSNYEMTMVSNSYLDSPTSISSLTYDIRYYMTNANTHFINRTGSDAGSLSDSRTISTITLMEIKG